MILASSSHLVNPALALLRINMPRYLADRSSLDAFLTAERSAAHPVNPRRRPRSRASWELPLAQQRDIASGDYGIAQSSASLDV